MFDVTEDVINYVEAETRNEEEFQKIWAELAKWKTDRDERVKKQAEEERKRKEREAQIDAEKIAELRDKAAAAVARYTVELFKNTSEPCTFDEVYQHNIEKYKKSEQALDFVKSLDKMLKEKTAAKSTCKCTNKSQSDEEKLEEYLRKAGLLN